MIKMIFLFPATIILFVCFTESTYGSTSKRHSTSIEDFLKSLVKDRHDNGTL